MIESWADGQVRDIQADMMRLTLEIVAKMPLRRGDGRGHGRGQRGDGDPHALLHRQHGEPDHHTPTGFPTPDEPPRRRGRCAGSTRILYAIIAERRRSGEDRGDLLSMLLRVEDEESGRRMTDRQLRDEA